MVVLIHSAVNNDQKRNIIRESWGTSKLQDGTIKLVFLVAATDNVQSQKMVSTSYLAVCTMHSQHFK